MDFLSGVTGQEEMKIFRPYQERAVHEVNTHWSNRIRTVCLQAPTGSGKTFMATALVKQHHDAGKRVWFVAHRHELLRQASHAFWDAGVVNGRMRPGKPTPYQRVIVASIQSIVRRLDTMPPPDLLVIDEAHHAVAASYLKLIRHCALSKILGLTATPARLDGQGLRRVFQVLVLGPQPKELIRDGYLANYRIVGPEAEMDMTGVRKQSGDYARGGQSLEKILRRREKLGHPVDNYMEHVYPGTCLVYCINRADARNVTKLYRDRGIDARYVAGDTPEGERTAAILGIESGKVQVIVSVDLFLEGLDCPGLMAVQMLRRTASLTVYLQAAGRMLRPFDGIAVLLDHVGNSHDFGTPSMHREWTLDLGYNPPRDADGNVIAPALRHCKECFAVHEMADTCPACGHVYPDPKTQQYDDTVLTELDKDELDRLAAEKKAREERDIDACRSLEDFVKLAIACGYKRGWAAKQAAMRRMGKSPYVFIQENKIRKSLGV